MKIDLSTAMMQSFDIKAEYNPPELLHQISNYLREDFSPQDWNRINYFKGKALYTMNQYKQANEIAMECIRESVVSKDYYTLVKGHILQGVSYYNTDSEDLIRPLFEMAAEYAIESADYELMISVQCAFLFYYRRQSQFEMAMKYEVRIVDLIKRVPISYTSACALGSIASLYIDLSKWDATIKYYTLALEQARELALEVFELSILNNLGSAICRLNDYPKAEMILNQGLVLARKMGHQQQVFLFTSNLGNLKIQEQQYWEAIQYYDTCMGILENVAQKPPLLLIDLYNNYSMCYWKLNRQDKSLSFIDKAIEIARDNGFERDLVQMEVNKTNLLVETGDYDEALKIVKRGIA